MRKIHNFIKNMPRRMKLEAAIAMSLTLVVIMSVSVFAWFSRIRKLGDLERMDSPTNLFITAAHDDVKYLQLTDIVVSDSSVKQKFYVFSVSGESANYYNLQLAYTTNNQFEYFVYPAHQLTATEISNNTPYLVKYTAHNDEGVETDTYYYSIETDSSINVPSGSFTGDANYRLWNGSQIRGGAVTTEFLNKVNNALIADSTMHDDTYSYKRYDDENANAEVGAQLYCEPIYWQARRIKSSMGLSTQFEDYYILEVNWEKAAAAAGAGGLKDDKETDIIYIAAEAAY